MLPRKIAGNPIQINKAMFVVIRWGMPFLRLTIVPARTCRMRDASWRRFIDTPTCLSSALQYGTNPSGGFSALGVSAVCVVAHLCSWRLPLNATDLHQDHIC